MTRPMVPVRLHDPVSPAAPGTQMAYRVGTVVNISKEKKIAVVRDTMGVYLEVRCDIMRAKGNIPAPGEQWVIDQQYGMWTFAAIINGGTDGVVIPPESVTGLPEIVTAYDERMTNIADDSFTRDADLESRTSGVATTKGDVLAAVASNSLARIPVGAVNQVLTPDTAANTGLAWKTPLALPSALTGATAASRFVGSTVTGPPATGTFVLGDWCIDRNGVIWNCWTAGSPGTWRSRLSERMDAQEVSVNQSFSWPSTAALNSGNNINLLSWNAQAAVGGTSPVTFSNGSFRLNRVGYWGITAWANLDHPVNGILQLEMRWINGGYRPVQSLVGTDHRQEGYAGCGLSWVNVSWSGWVDTTASTAPIQMWMYQSNRLAEQVGNIGYYINFSYMGGAG